MGAGLLLAALSAPLARADTIYWGGGTGTFGTAANWIGGVAPDSNDTAAFQGWAPLSRSGWSVSASINSGSAGNAKDGSRSTLWSTGTNQVSGQYFIVDMGSTQTFKQLTLDSTTVTTDYPRSFDVYVSSDGSSWGSAVYSGSGSSALVTVTFSSAQTKRYIKIQLTGSQANWWQIGELFVYGTSGETELSRNGWTASASASAGGAASQAIDGDYGTKWSPGSAQAVGQWFTVDMGSAQTFTRIDMDAYSQPTDYPRGYDVYVSSDGSSWGSPIASGSGTTGFTSITFSSQTKRYIKVMLDTSDGFYWWAMFEFKVYGTPGNCTISSNASVDVLRLDKNITVTQSSGVTLTVATDLYQSTGTFTGGNSTISVGDDFVLSGGTFTSTSGLLKIAGAYTQTGGTFTHNSGRVMLASTTSQTFAPNSATFNNLIINDGLAGYWPLDEGSGTSTADGSGNGNTGTVSGAGATWQSSVSSSISFRDPYSIALNGSTGYVTLGTSGLPAINGAQTISLWAKLNATGGSQNLVALSNLSSSGVQVKISGTNLGVYGWGGTTYVATTAPSTGAWHHIAYTYNGSGAQALYIDGVATTASTSNQSGTVTGAYLGTYSPSNEMFNGSLDDVRIYTRALSETEINAIYLGNQPATSVATQSMSGSMTVSGDLTIASGGLYLSTNTISLAGDWWNYGGAFWGDYWAGATLNLTGTSTTNYIRSAGQFLPAINITGTGKWTLEDDLDVDPNNNVTFTSGSMDIGTHTLRTGGLVGGSGTFTGTSGTVVLDGNSSRTLSVGSFNVLRIEDPSSTNLVGYWKLDEGQGLYARDWSGTGYTATLTNNPRWSTTVPSTIEFYNPASLLFDGTDDYADVGSAVTASNAAFSACAWVYFNSTGGQQTMVSIDGTNISGFFLKKNGTPRFSLDMYGSDSTGATRYAATGTTAVATATWYHVCGVYTGSVARIYVNGAQEGADVSVGGAFNATGHTILGASKWSGARGDYVNGRLDDVRIYDVALTAAQVKALANGRYTNNAGVATYTLGTSLTVGGTLALDSGGLSTSSYTVNLANSDATKVAYVGAGTYTVGAGTNNFKGGLTVRNEGTLALSGSSSVAAIGSGKTLTIDGTLDASTAGTTPTIQSVSGSYTFTVGSSSTATPVLNIDGLAVKNTGIDGMYINAVAGSSTTFTKFDNIAFSNGDTSVGSTFIRIYATSLSLFTTGHTFTFASSKPDYAVKLAGNGTGDGETRAIFGAALCPSSLCTTSNKSDDDSDNDGVGDTSNGTGNEAVLQFVRAAPADTAGAIEGFPTAAFDWNTFVYYSTYVAYRNYSGSQDRIFVRSSSGAASYYWDVPTAAGHVVGTPRWTQLSGTKYVYVGTSAGYVYKLIDNGSSSLTLASSPWDTPYCYGGSPCSANDTITSPLGIDGTNVYWVGTDSSSNRKFFILTHGKSLTSASLSIPAAVTAAPAQATVSSIDYLFAGMQGYLYKIKISDQSSTSWTQPATTCTINGRVTVQGGLAYLADNRGRIYVVSASGLSTDWSYQDTGNHGGSCSDGGNCTIKNIYVDQYARVIYGDQDGHIYVITKNGSSATVMTGYPLQPASGEAITTSPLYQAGIVVAGTSSGSLFVINLRTASGGTPSLVRTYKLGSAVSSIAYNSNTNSSTGAYMVGTANGKLFFIDKVTDGDAYP